MPRILHIEDDPANRLLVRKLLASQGFSVIEAEDGLEGIRKACSEKPDLVLVDINVPHLDGYEVTLRLRGEAALSGVPIVAITAEGDRDTSLAVGCDGFLQKPIDARTFAKTVAGYLKTKRESVAPARDDRLRQQSQKIVVHLEAKLAELEATNQRLRELDRARTTFYRNVSHELATPMTPIVGYLGMLLGGDLGALSKPQERAVRSMDECVRRLRGVIDNLLDVTGLETGKLRMVVRDYDLATVLDGLFEKVRARAEDDRVRVVFSAPKGPLPARGDADRLVGATMELLENALKFMTQASTRGTDPKPPLVGIGVAVSEHEILITVADRGPGIDPSLRQRVFDPFFQADGSPTRSFGGTGVGLAVVRGVALAHRGSAEVLDRPVTIAGEPFDGAAVALRLARHVAG